ncbi:putative aldouronate transport system permease protein [Paenibacillus sp. V4I3]|uniref:carbohydrate ABC transporter permease n=1 Tax=unclassified Paenibacillus TaxID=185978 RepID=UPI002780E5FD|nr:MULTISPECIES: carbohydrate ABC transporter permease [unclassified Paenibacillus]MDQ0873653.1 putative aldouronate transport system permease protein [Paenibacillus sp. V4I3]MDQ0890415.1 putative aldouronate transport system permease protein [Paenibacillus sp. V4I9]
MHKQTFSEKMFERTNTLLLVLIGIVSIFPLYYVFCVSFTDPAVYLKGGLILYPQGFTLENYRYLLSTPLFPRSMGISVYLAVIGTAMSLMVTSALAYALSRKRMLGRKSILLLILFTTLFQPGLIPNYLLIKDLGLINSLWALILPALSSGWNVFLIKSFFDSIPSSLEEAAVIDGCNDVHVWWRIILPLSLPALATFGLFFAIGYWNVFFNAVLYINDFQKWPLQLVLRQMLIDSSTSAGGGNILEEGQIINPQSIKMAAVLIATIPILMVYPFLQKHFTKGVLVGSIKE